MPTALLLKIEFRTMTAAELAPMPYVLLLATVSVTVMLAPAPDADTPTPFDQAVTRLSAPAAEFATKMPLFPLWVTTVSETNNELAPLGAKLIPQLLKLRIRDFWTVRDSPEVNWIP